MPSERPWLLWRPWPWLTECGGSRHGQCPILRVSLRNGLALASMLTPGGRIIASLQAAQFKKRASQEAYAAGNLSTARVELLHRRFKRGVSSESVSSLVGSSRHLLTRSGLIPKVAIEAAGRWAHRAKKAAE
eukprot:4627636-Prymnesium_polylepis.1